MEYSKNGKVYYFENILSKEQLQLFINNELEGEYLRDEEIVTITLTQTDKFYLDLDFGQLLINEFLIDNRNLPHSFTPTQNLTLLSKFENVKELCYLGDTKSVAYLITQIVVDEIFTQDRKDKYSQMITKHLLYEQTV